MSKQFNPFTVEQAVDYVTNCTTEQLEQYKEYFEKRKRMARRPADGSLPGNLQQIQDAIDARG